MALFVQLDVNWVDHHKVIAVGFDGAGLHAAAMCLAKRLETDGIIHRAQLARIGAPDDLIGRLIAFGLLDDIGDDRVYVHGWLERNAAFEDYSANARIGNHKRWKHPGPVETCPKCSPPDRPPIAGRVGATRGDQPPTLSTEHPDSSDLPVDNNDNGEAPSSVAMPRPPIAPRVAPRSPSESPRVLESETDSESESETPPPSRNPRGLPPNAHTALDAIAARRMLNSTTEPANPAAFRRSIRAGVERDHLAEVWRILHDAPDIEPTALVDRLEPPSPSATPGATPEPGRRYDIRTEEQTAAMLDEQRAFTPPDPDTVNEAAAAARHALQHPHADPEAQP